MTRTSDWLEATDNTSAMDASIEYCLHGNVYQRDVLDIAAVPFEEVDPVRSFTSWPGKCNFEGRFWFSSTRQHVGFESCGERTFLATIDRWGDVVGVSSQPMWIRWRSSGDHMRLTSSPDAWTARDFS